MKMSERDYAHLKGTEVIVFKGREYYDAIVAGCDYNVGITIQSIDGEKLLCLNTAVHANDYNNYNGVFASMVAKIKRGTIKYDMPDKVRKKLPGYDGYGSFTQCAFLS